MAFLWWAFLLGGAAALSAPASGVATWAAANGVVRVELNRGGKLNALNRPMWEALRRAAEGEAPLVITSGDPKAFSSGGDVRSIAGGPAREVVEFLHLEYTTLAALRGRSGATIAVSDGITMGAGAGVFMACDSRVVTEQTRFAMPEVKIALCPDAGALAFLTRHCEPAVARFLAVSGYSLNAHDLVTCGLATHFVPTKQDQLVPLLDELSRAPSGELAVPLSRRSAAAPAHLATPLFTEPALAALRKVFGEPASSVAAAVEKLDAARAEARKSVGSCGWATREIAEQVLDILDSAAAAIAAAPPTACQVTLDAVDALLVEAERRGGATDDPKPLADFGACVELAANARLGTLPDFAEGVACAIGDKRGETPAWDPTNRAADVRGAVAAVDPASASLDDVRDAALGAQGG